MPSTLEEKAMTGPIAPVSVTAPRTRMPSQRTLTIIAVVVAVLALGAWMFVTSGRRKEVFANRSLLEARSTAEQGNLPLAATQFQRVMDTYRGTDASREALIGLNQVRMVNGQSDLAAVSLREFLATNPPPKYAAPANGMLAAALENAGRPADAAESYRRASAVADVEYLKAEYLIQAGRAYLAAGKRTEAEAAYRQVIRDYPKSTSITEAKVRLAEITGGAL